MSKTESLPWIVMIKHRNTDKTVYSGNSPASSMAIGSMWRRREDYAIIGTDWRRATEFEADLYQYGVRLLTIPNF